MRDGSSTGCQRRCRAGDDGADPGHRGPGSSAACSEGATTERRQALAAVGLAVLCIAGCNGQEMDDTPVPEAATGPYACPRVPWEGARFDGRHRRPRGPGRLRSVGCRGSADQFHCSLATRDGADQSRAVEVRDYGAFAPAEVTAEAMRGIDGAQAIRADQPGGATCGTTTRAWSRPAGSATSGTSSWDFFHYGQPAQGRDAHADVTRYLTSMLPWACGGEDVPS